MLENRNCGSASMRMLQDLEGFLKKAIQPTRAEATLDNTAFVMTGPAFTNAATKITQDLIALFKTNRAAIGQEVTNILQNHLPAITQFTRL